MFFISVCVYRLFTAASRVHTQKEENHTTISVIAPPSVQWSRLRAHLQAQPSVWGWWRIHNEQMFPYSLWFDDCETEHYNIPCWLSNLYIMFLKFKHSDLQLCWSCCLFYLVAILPFKSLNSALYRRFVFFKVGRTICVSCHWTRIQSEPRYLNTSVLPDSPVLLPVSPTVLLSLPISLLCFHCRLFGSWLPILPRNRFPSTGCSPKKKPAPRPISPGSLSTMGEVCSSLSWTPAWILGPPACR